MYLGACVFISNKRVCWYCTYFVLWKKIIIPWARPPEVMGYFFSSRVVSQNGHKCVSHDLEIKNGGYPYVPLALCSIISIKYPHIRLYTVYDAFSAATKQLGLEGTPKDLALRPIHGASVTCLVSPSSQPKSRFLINGAFTAAHLRLVDHSYPVTSLQRKTSSSSLVCIVHISSPPSSQWGWLLWDDHLPFGPD